MRERGGDAPSPDEGEGTAARDGSEPRDAGAERASPRPASEAGADQPSDGPPAPSARDDEPPAPSENPVRWYLHSTNPVVVGSRDVLTSVLLVGMVGLTLFAVSGVWPPMVAIESGSMEPNMEKGDLVVVVESDRFTSQHADENGIVTRDVAEGVGHEEFGNPGSVIVYQPDGRERTPIIHRTVLRVEEGENWIDRADPAHLSGVDSCDDTAACPAPHDGYVTRGDANSKYDQIEPQQSGVVRTEWVNGKAVARVPYLGCIRLELSQGPKCFDDRREATASALAQPLSVPPPIPVERVAVAPALRPLAAS